MVLLETQAPQLMCGRLKNHSYGNSSMVLSHGTIYFAVKRSSSFECEKIDFLGIL